jgi:hypothetical protein
LEFLKLINAVSPFRRRDEEKRRDIAVLIGGGRGVVGEGD